MKNKLILGVLLIFLNSCNNSELIGNSDENILEQYQSFSKTILNSFSDVFSQNGGQTRGEEDITPQQFAEHITQLTDNELTCIQDSLINEYPEYVEAEHAATENLLEIMGLEEYRDYQEFCEEYIYTDDKLELLTHTLIGKSDIIKDIYICTSAAIDNIALTISDTFIQSREIHVKVKGEYSFCEHQLIMDLVKMCVGDVFIEIEGGGPEDPVANVTCAADDVISIITSYVEYIKCKHDERK